MFKSCMLKTSHVPARQNSNMQGHNMTVLRDMLRKGSSAVPLMLGKGLGFRV